MAADLVTVVTATWGRPRTILERAVPSVDCQDYRPLEHLIVTDGYDPALNTLLRGHGYSEKGITRRLVSLGRNWTQPFGNGSNGAVARAVGGWMARGEYVCWLDDDNILSPSHVTDMVKCLTETGADIACSDFAHPSGMIGGPPRVGTVDASSFMIRATVLTRGNWLPDGYECDGHVVERWVSAGCTVALKAGATMRITSQRFGAPD